MSDEIEAGPGVQDVEREPEPIVLGDRVRLIGESTQALMKMHAERHAAERVAITKRAEPAAVAKTADAADTTATSNALPSADEANTIFTNAGAIFPPYDPETLVMLFEHSGSLRPNVDAYVTNIESFGYKLEATLDLEASDIDGKIGDAMFLERLRKSVRAPGADEVAQADYPTPKEIAAKKKAIGHAMRLEKAQLENFIEGAVPESSFTDLREKTRADEEITGNAFWEVLRNGRGEVSQFTYIPSHQIRLLPIQPDPIEVRVKERVSALSYETTTRRRRFRFFVQVVYNRVVYFKEFGDPRAMCARTGRLFQSEEAMRQEDPGAVPATEIVHFKVHSSRTPYGIPRWIGNLLAVLGSRSAEEVNYLYFDNKAVPPLAILVSGGRLTEPSVKKIESYVKDHIRGKENFHKILIIEGQSAAAANPSMPDNGRVRVELTPLREAQQNDALFQQYDERNIDKVGSAFRVPRLLRGDVRDFNRATADAALEFTEMQVFQPERNRRDEWMNRQILPSMGIRFWRYVSKTPVSKDPDTLTKILVALVQANILTPGEAREEVHDILNREVKKLDEDWTKIPVQLLLAGVLPDGGAPMLGEPQATAGGVGAQPAAQGTAPAAPQDRNLAAVAANLSALRDRLRGAAKSAHDRVAKDAHRAEAANVIRIPVDKDEIDSWFEKEA